MRTLTVVTLIFGSVAALPAADPVRALSPRTVSAEKSTAVLGQATDAVAKQAGIPVTVPPNLLKSPLKGFEGFSNVPFWDGLQRAADASNTRIALTGNGREVGLVPRGGSREVSATSGAFRVVAQQVTGRALLTEGITVHEVALLVHWEPRLRVYRIDTSPNVSKVTDVPGSKIAAETGGARVLPTGASSEMKVRLTGLTRASERITSLAGSFTVTGAEKLLAFEFAAPGGKLPEPQTQDNVTAALKRVQKKGTTWEIVVEVNYPPGQPVFESFQGEWWLRDNRMVLSGPGGKTFVIDDYEIPAPDSPRPLRVIHRFKEDPATGLGDPTAKGWSIRYETPGSLSDVQVPFELKDVPLP